MLLSASNLKVGYPGNELFSGITFMVQSSDKIGVIGDNGCGKSSFFSALLEEGAFLGGDISKKKGLRIAHLEQSLSASLQKTVWDFACEARADIFVLEREIEQLSREQEADKSQELMHRLADMQERFALAGGYSVQAEIKSVLTHLNFFEESWNLPLNTLSGGQVARLQLAKVLLSKFDLLLLDEPTNHLDFLMISWLEKYLLNLKKPYLVISHNRSFLDKVTSKLFHLNQKNLTVYHGDFAHFQKEFVLLRQKQEKDYLQQKKQIEKTKDFVARNMAGQKTKQAASRLRALEKMDILSAPASQKEFSIKFNKSGRTGQKVLECKKLAVGYGEKTLAEKIDLLLSYGDRVAIVGKNGCGKSTFLSTICGMFSPLSGEIKHGSKLKIGYFDQNHFQLDGQQSVLQAIWDFLPGEPIGKPLSYLAVYGFSGETVERKVATLSGGEKSRLYLARLILQNPNLLILDEPTNHLDLKTILALEKALASYQGSLLFVSHDKYFVEKLASKFWIFEKNSIKERLDCDYSEFEYRKNKPKKTQAEQKKTSRRVNPHKLELMEKEIAELEAKLKALEENLQANYQLLADKNIYQNSQKLSEVNEAIFLQEKKIGELKEDLEKKETDYLELC